MVVSRWMIYCLCVIVAISLASCKVNNRNSANATSNSPTANEPDRGVTGVEKVKPAPGTGNVQGKCCYSMASRLRISRLSYARHSTDFWAVAVGRLTRPELTKMVTTLLRMCRPKCMRDC